MKKILIINDCKLESMILNDILTELGYKCKFTSEFLALNEIRSFYPDIVISNLVMKRVNGDKLIKKIKDFDENIVCILSSSNELYLEDYFEYKVDAVINTPVNSEKLKNIIEGLNGDSKICNNNYEFCPYCGKKLKNSSYVYCPYCGHEVKNCEATL